MKQPEIDFRVPSGRALTERRTEDVEKYPQNDGRMKAADKSYLA